MDEDTRQLCYNLKFSRRDVSGDIVDEWSGVIKDYRYLLQSIFIGQHKLGTHRFICWHQRRTVNAAQQILFEAYLDWGSEQLVNVDQITSGILKRNRMMKFRRDSGKGVCHVTEVLANNLVMTTEVKKFHLYARQRMLTLEQLDKIAEVRRISLTKQLEREHAQIALYWDIVARYAQQNYLHPLPEGSFMMSAVNPGISDAEVLKNNVLLAVDE